MKKWGYIFILSLLLTACQNQSNEKSYNMVQKELTEALETQSPYEHEFVRGIYISPESDPKNSSTGEHISVHLYYNDDSSIEQDFILVRDTVVNYSETNNCSFSSLTINIQKSLSGNIYWHSNDFESGSYNNELSGNTLYDITLEELANLDVATLSNNTIAPPVKISNDLIGRGISDSGRSEPQYVGVSGYIVVGTKQEDDLKSTDTFAETPWTIPSHLKNSNALLHKTEVVVKSQKLKHEGWGRYSGQLTVEITNTKEQTIIDVSNFITKPYWTYDDLIEASKIGYFIAEYHQKSSYYPVDRDNKKVSLEDGTKVLVTGSTGTYSGNAPNKTLNSIEAIVYKEWKYEYGGVDVYFNPKDLTLIY